MNIVSPEFIRDYLLEYFEGEGNISSGGSELVVPSVFLENDWKRHMSINLDTGLWQCFKSGEQGNFIKLYAYLENMSYSRAEAELLFKDLIETGNFCSYTPPKTIITEKEQFRLEAVTVEDLDSEDLIINRAWDFIFSRGLYNLKEVDQPVFYIDREGRYRDRIIIPFHDDDGEVFYFQARTLANKQPKYLNPPSASWPKSSNILYPFKETEKEVIVCEGPIDALSFQVQGVNATSTQGSDVSEAQILELAEFGKKIVVAYDNDEAGAKGMKRFDKMRKIKRMAEIYICHPPSEFKDWNEAHINGCDLRKHIDEHARLYDYDYIMDHLLTSL